MNVKKLDNRFKLYKAGLANYMIEVDSGSLILRKMEGLYGIGQMIMSRDRHIRNKGEWFYSFQYRTETFRNTPGANVDVKTFTTRIYFRREEQATFLAMALSK